MGLASDEFKIDVAADGNGGTFEIIIEGVEVASVPTRAERENNLKDYDGIIFEPGTIPVADDIGYNRELVQRFFKDNGDITFLEAENGEETNKKAREHLPDLIFARARDGGP